ncbi:MAG TPA: sugar ABC transporter permease [Frankiaceae bacterium]|nr:sugar ABC transporter permease [Frankiaceae bacterium]
MTAETRVQLPDPSLPPDGTTSRPQDWRARSDRRLGWLLVSPLILLLLGLVSYPLADGAITSLWTSDPVNGVPNRFVGLGNYRDVLAAPETRAALLHTFAYLAIALVLEIVLGMVFALTLRRPFRGRVLVFTALVLPWALPGVVSGLLWTRVFDTDNGVLNSLLLQLHVTSGRHAWLASPLLSILVITVVHVWGVLPLTVLVLLSGLNGIPADLYGAAAVDGASRLRQFWHITLPLLRPAVAVALTTGTVAALAIFDEIYVLNGTALSTRSAMMQVYDTTFRQLDFGHGSALSILLTVVTIVLAAVWVVAFRRVAR